MSDAGACGAHTRTAEGYAHAGAAATDCGANTRSNLGPDAAANTRSNGALHTAADRGAH